MSRQGAEILEKIDPRAPPLRHFEVLSLCRVGVKA